MDIFNIDEHQVTITMHKTDESFNANTKVSSVTVESITYIDGKAVASKKETFHTVGNPKSR